jgi:hypothetical protein
VEARPEPPSVVKSMAWAVKPPYRFTLAPLGFRRSVKPLQGALVIVDSCCLIQARLRGPPSNASTRSAKYCEGPLDEAAAALMSEIHDRPYAYHGRSRQADSHISN